MSDKPLNSYTIDLGSFNVEAENADEATKKAWHIIRTDPEMFGIDQVILAEHNFVCSSCGAQVTCECGDEDHDTCTDCEERD